MNSKCINVYYRVTDSINCPIFEFRVDGDDGVSVRWEARVLSPSTRARLLKFFVPTFFAFSEPNV